jgi:ferritin-like protein
MIRLRTALVQNLEDPDKLRTVLQTAMELEHATIPPYLFAAYSLTQANAPIRRMILDVAREEMLHMTLVCNLLNAVGGTPRLKGPGFVPSYPTHLPGAVQGHLLVSLQAFSRDVVTSTFKPIEEPEHPKTFPEKALVAEVQVTIGEFYRRIRGVIEQKGDAAIVGDPARQVMVTIDDDDSFVVTDVASALRAIDLIVGQGEGTETSPLDRPNGEPAHFYRFEQILRGHALRDDPSVPEKYSYSGSEIRFDPAAVLPAKTDIKLADLPVDSEAYQLAAQFNRDYATMLEELHRTFNGEPDRLDAAANLMRYALKKSALQLMQIELTPGVHAGPTFEVVTT